MTTQLPSPEVTEVALPMTPSQSSATIDSIIVAERKSWTESKYRSYVTVAVIVSACALWLLTLGKLGAAREGAPWYATIVSAALAGVLAVLRPSARLSDFELRKPGLREPTTLLESWSIAYLGASVLLYAWVAAQAFLPPEPPVRIVQFVDIQLVSNADHENKQNPMPGTEEQTEQHKRDSDAATVQGSLASTTVAAVSKQAAQVTADQPPPAHHQMTPKPHPMVNNRAQKETKQVMPERQVLAYTAHSSDPAASHPMSAVVMMPLEAQPQQPRTTPKTTSVTAGTGKPAASKTPLFEEVAQQQPELVEMIENDGARTNTTVSENGGRSEGGTGAANDLSNYIKDLHKRIKSSWAPPRGQSRRAKLLFRIQKNGQLAFVKVLASSGDPDTDSAAMESVKFATNHRPLPTDYGFAYLDVQYTFNYGADEMKELQEVLPQ